MKRQRNIIYGKSDNTEGSPPLKKLAIPSTLVSPKPLPKPLHSSSSTSHLKQFPIAKSTPLKSANVPKSSSSVEQSDETSELIFEVLWTNRSNKMHKTYENGHLKVSGSKCVLLDPNQKAIGTSTNYTWQKLSNLKEDDELILGDKELKVSGSCQSISTVATSSSSKATPKQKSLSPALAKSLVAEPKKPSIARKGPLHTTTTAPKIEKAAYNPYISKDGSDIKLYSSPKGSNQVDVVIEPFLASKMRPHQVEGVKFMYECCTGLRNYVPIGSDDQGDVMDVDQPNLEKTSGCILADVMGLGKTLQSIALIRVMLTQSPRGSSNPHAKKAIVVAPSSLVYPWEKELMKWLGKERINVIVVAEKRKEKKTTATSSNSLGSKKPSLSSKLLSTLDVSTESTIKRFANSVDQKLLIISYDQVRIHFEALKNIEFGILICDEGHRLKNQRSQINVCLSSLKTQSRVILTGTPFQNNLSEYYTLVDFVNPRCLGSYDEFRQRYEKVIGSSKNSNLGHNESDLNNLEKERSKELHRRTSGFILRRTSKVLEAFLPEKVEQVVFCKPTECQVQIYRMVLNEMLGIKSQKDASLDTSLEEDELEALEDLPNLDQRSALACMMKLSKVCNHPELLITKDTSAEPDKLQRQVAQLLETYTKANSRSDTTEISSKLNLLDQMIVQAQNLYPTDKHVIVSSFTQTLDVISKLLETRNIKHVRIDGSTDVETRNLNVEKFQKDPKIVCFLLSTKAGGMGLNLYAANRLVLFDSSWNPAFDTQAQARIWREGQSKKCWIYRFLSTGMIDEKIFQRQLIKNDMGRTILDDEDLDDEIDFAQSQSLSKADLKNIFSLNTKTLCDTHDLSGCSCVTSRSNSKTKNPPSISADDISDWEHVSCVASHYKDPLLQQIAVADNNISFLFGRFPKAQKKI